MDREPKLKMMSLTYSVTLRAFLSLWLFGTCFTFSHAQAPAHKTWIAKFNLLSPIGNNLSGELEYMAWNRVSIFAGGGIDEGFEDLWHSRVGICTEDRTYGVYLGGKYLLKTNRTASRGVDGLGLKGFFGFQKTDQLRQTCPTWIQSDLESLNAFSLNTALSYQKTFWDRLFLEAQVGIGAGVDWVKFDNSDWTIGRPDVTLFYVSAPVGLHVGFMF